VKDIILGPGERWTDARSFEAVLWCATRLASQFRMGATASVGHGSFSLSDLDGSTYSHPTTTWSASAGPGVGPAFLLFGVSGPAMSIRSGTGSSFGRAMVVHLSLNLTADLVALLKVSGPFAPP
jgi:hypothetical protein